MHLDGWTLLLQAINLGVLLALLRWLFYRPLLRVIEARRQSVADQIAAAAAATQQADEKAKTLSADRSALEASRSQVLEGARQEAAAERKTLDAAMRHEADARLATARQQIELERSEARQTLFDEASKLATALAARLLSTASGPIGDAALDAALREQLAATPADEREAWFEAGAARVVNVVSAHPSTAAEQAIWRDHLGAVFGAATSITFDADASLLAGAELRFTNGVLALTWRGELDAARAQMQQSAKAIA